MRRVRLYKRQFLFKLNLPFFSIDMDNHLSALEAITDDVSIYMAGRLRHKLFNLPNDYPAESMSHVLVTHCERAIAVIADAWTNPPIIVKWEVDDYLAAMGKQPTGMYPFSITS